MQKRGMIGKVDVGEQMIINGQTTENEVEFEVEEQMFDTDKVP